MNPTAADFASVTTHVAVHYRCAGTSIRWFKMRTTSTLSRVWHLKISRANLRGPCGSPRVCVLHFARRVVPLPTFVPTRHRPHESPAHRIGLIGPPVAVAVFPNI